MFFILDKSRLDPDDIPTRAVLIALVQDENQRYQEVTATYPAETFVVMCDVRPCDVPESGIFWLERTDYSDFSILANPRMPLEQREALLSFRKSVYELQAQTGNFHCDPRNVHRLNLHVDAVLGREGRLRLYSWLVGREIKTTNNLTQKEAAGMLRFGQPEKIGKSQYDYTHEFLLAVKALEPDYA